MTTSSSGIARTSSRRQLEADRDVVLAQRAESGRDVAGAPCAVAGIGAGGGVWTCRRDGGGTRTQRRRTPIAARCKRVPHARVPPRAAVQAATPSPAASSSRPSPVDALNGITCSSSSAELRVERREPWAALRARELVDLRDDDDRRHARRSPGSRASRRSSSVGSRRTSSSSTTPRSCGARRAGTPRSAAATSARLLLRDARVAVARAGRRARSASFTWKKLISRVRPGVLLTRANALRRTSLLSSDDLPTFERPANAISGSVVSRPPPVSASPCRRGTRAARMTSGSLPAGGSVVSMQCVATLGRRGGTPRSRRSPAAREARSREHFVHRRHRMEAHGRAHLLGKLVERRAHSRAE